jgi:hypothetical protein
MMNVGHAALSFFDERLVVDVGVADENIPLVAHAGTTCSVIR